VRCIVSVGMLRGAVASMETKEEAVAPKVLVAYASKHGTTREVAESIARTFGERGLAVEIEEARRVRDITRYDVIVVGGGLYMGKWHADAMRLLKRHREELVGKRLAVFGMGPDSLDESKVVESRKQLDRALADTPELEPIAVAIFGGALKPDSWRFPFNREWADGLVAKLSPAVV
jgi:menaquinone-dependent protoporphyrinogen oxidase